MTWYVSGVTINLTHSPTRSVSVTSSTAFDNRRLIVHVRRRTQLETSALEFPRLQILNVVANPALPHWRSSVEYRGTVGTTCMCRHVCNQSGDLTTLEKLRRKFWFSPVDSDNIISSCLGPSSFAHTQISFSVRLPGFNNIAISYPSSAWRYINGVYNVVYLNIWLWLSQPSTVLSESMTFRRRKMR